MRESILWRPTFLQSELQAPKNGMSLLARVNTSIHAREPCTWQPTAHSSLSWLTVAVLLFCVTTVPLPAGHPVPRSPRRPAASDAYARNRCAHSVCEWKRAIIARRCSCVVKHSKRTCSNLFKVHHTKWQRNGPARPCRYLAFTTIQDVLHPWANPDFVNSIVQLSLGCPPGAVRLQICRACKYEHKAVARPAVLARQPETVRRNP